MATEPISREIERLEYSMKLLKDVITIILGIAFTNTIYWFVMNPETGTLRSLTSFSFSQIVLFFVVLTTLVRFYHGNVRHLSEDYSRIRIIEEKRTGFELALDFFFIFLQSIVFVIMSFYINYFPQIYDLFIILFVIDIFWFLLLGLARAKFELKYPEMKWTVVNILTVFVLLVLRDIAHSDPNTLGIRLLLIIIFANMMLDYGINWQFYFPKISARGLTVFLAAPFTHKLVPDETAETGYVIEENFRKLLSRIIQQLRARGYLVKNAFEREDWGRKKVSPKEMVEKDYFDVISSDVLVVYLDTEPSFGVFIELGWATAFRRNVILLVRKGQEDVQKKWTPLMEGLHVLAQNFREIIFEDEDDMLNELLITLDRIRLYGKIS